MKKIKLFGKNVMLRMEEKESAGPKIHLPDSARKNEDNATLFDIIVIGVGDEVTKVVVGDVVMSHLPSYKSLDPSTGEKVVMVQEDMIQGVVVEEVLTEG